MTKLRPGGTLHKNTRIILSLLYGLLCGYAVGFLIKSGPASHTYTNSILPWLAAAFGALVGWSILPRLKLRSSLLSYGFGALYALMLITGRRLNTYESLALEAGGFADLIPGTLLGGLAIAGCLLAVIGLLPRCLAALTSGKPAAAASRFFSHKRAPLVIFLLLLLCWLPALIALWPGGFHYDAPFQAEQIYTGLYNDHHPLFHTLFIAPFLHIVWSTGNYPLGILLHSITQSLFLAGIFTGCMRILHRWRLPSILQAFVLGWLCLFPINGIWAINATKDVLFGGCLLLCTLLLADMALCPDRPLSRWRVAGNVAGMAMLILTRNQGLYILLLTIPLILIFLKKHRLKLCALLGCAILLGGLSNTGLRLILNADKGNIGEMLSVPLQQLGRVVTQEVDTLTFEQLSDIYAYMNETAANSYEPYLADKAKSGFDDELFAKDPMRFIKLWLNVGLSHTRTYIDAFLLLNTGYWYLGQDYRDRVLYMEIRAVSNTAGLPTYDQPVFSKHLTKFYESIAVERSFENIPLISLLFSTALPFWLLLFMVLLALIKKQYTWGVPLGFLFIFWLTLMASPVVNARYIYPMQLATAFLLPVVLWQTCGKTDEG